VVAQFRHRVPLTGVVKRLNPDILRALIVESQCADQGPLLKRPIRATFAKQVLWNRDDAS